MPITYNGCLPDPQANYLKYNIPAIKSAVIPNSDLRQYSTERHHQGSTSSCVAQAVVKALEIKRVIKYGTSAHKDLSRMQVWYLSREMMNPPRNREDSGTHISYACDVLRRFGVSEESKWPWDTSKFDVSPTWSSMRDAYRHRIEAYLRIDSTGSDRVRHCKIALAAKQPIVFGTSIGDNWHNYTAGQILGEPSEVTGYHATVLVGWNGTSFIGENSWGIWGDNGFYLISPDVIASSESYDFWTVKCPWE